MQQLPSEHTCRQHVCWKRYVYDSRQREARHAELRRLTGLLSLQLEAKVATDLAQFSVDSVEHALAELREAGDDEPCNDSTVNINLQHNI